MTSNKTKAVIVTFSSELVEAKPVEITEEFKYLGTVFKNVLRFSSKTEDILRRWHQRLIRF